MSSLRRIGFEELPVELSSRLQARVTRLGYFGEFFQCAAHQPAALAAFIDFTEAGKTDLPANLVEVIALTCAGWMGNTYERNQHERLCLKLGLSRDWIAAVNLASPSDAPVMSGNERDVQRLVLTLLETRGKGASALVENAVRTLGEASAVAILMVVGRYVVHGLIVNSLELDAPVPSIFSGEEAA